MALEVFSVGPHPSGDTLLVVFKEYPMTYICSFQKDGTPERLADSLELLDRGLEAELAFRAWMEEHAQRHQ